MPPALLASIIDNLKCPQLECSFHVASCFLSLFVRVFRAPDRASGELIDSGTCGDEEQIPLVVEIQHREGDRLYFAALFSEIMREFKVKGKSDRCLLSARKYGRCLFA